MAVGAPEADPEPQSVRQPVSPEQANAFLSFVTKLSWWWTVAMIAVAIVASIDLTRPASGGVSVHLQVGTVTLAAIALIWLPPIVRLLSLTGGGLKAFGFEASAGGLGSAPEALIVGLARIRTEVAEVERATPGAADRTESVRVEVDRIASAYLGGTAAAASAELSALARRYESVRASQPPSRDRAITMNQILDEARVRANASPESAAQSGHQLLDSAADGDRVIGLALLQQRPSADALPEILRVVQSSRSAFEQYHAVLAVQAVAPLLSVEQRDIAIAALQQERTDPREKGLSEDPFIPQAITSALVALGADTR